MTIQIALATQGRGVVFASDTKVRVTEKVFTNNPYRPESMVTHPKIVVRDQIAVALAGFGDGEEDPARELADYLSEQVAISEGLSSLLIPWGDRYFQRKFPGQRHEFPVCTLLVVDPKNEYCQFRKLRVGHNSSDEVSSTCILNGQERSPVVFWPEYFKCDKKIYDLETATNIAAITILMAAELNNYGVGGLEIWRYRETWERLTRVEIEALIARFERFKGSRTAPALRCSSHRERQSPHSNHFKDVQMSEQQQLKHREKPDMQRVYSNCLNGAKTIFDFRLTFTEVVDVTDTEMTVEDRVVVTLAWGQAKVLRDFLTEVIANIEGINGEIKPVSLSSAVEPESVKLPIQ